jgi:hypothetical protein
MEDETVEQQQPAEVQDPIALAARELREGAAFHEALADDQLARSRLSRRTDPGLADRYETATRANARLAQVLAYRAQHLLPGLAAKLVA